MFRTNGRPALTLPPAFHCPSPGETGGNQKGPWSPSTHHPGSSKPRPKPVGPGPGGRNGPESKGSGLAHGPPTLHPGPPKPRPKPVGPGPGPPTPPTHHPSPELWSMVMSMLGSIISWSGKNTILHVSIFRELVWKIYSTILPVVSILHPRSKIYCLDTVWILFSILHVAFRYSTEYFPRACFENILHAVSLLRPRSKIYSQDTL